MVTHGPDEARSSEAAGGKNCPVCERSFSSQYAVNAHMASHKRNGGSLKSEKRPSRFYAEASLRPKKNRRYLAGEIPSTVSRELGAGDGDKLIFERGCLQVTERAALLGPYMIVRLKPRTRQDQAVRDETAVVGLAAQESQVPAGESFAQAVKQKLETRNKR